MPGVYAPRNFFFDKKFPFIDRWSQTQNLS